jgi:catechol 2,3-dioxygenase-like lactoylglutathione lyase family enzyme
MVHVADVDRSVEFYVLLGFECVSRFSGHDGKTNWADLVSKEARIMLARASAPVDAEVQAVLFYLYSEDVRLLQQHLLAQGIPHAGPPPQEGIACPPPNGAAVFDIVPRFFMPAGELRIHDPDGYCLLVGQLD